MSSMETLTGGEIPFLLCMKKRIIGVGLVFLRTHVDIHLGLTYFNLEDTEAQKNVIRAK